MYTTQTQVSQFLQRPLTATEAQQFTAASNAVTTQINHRLGTAYSVDLNVPVTRRYRTHDHNRFITIDFMSSVTAVAYVGDNGVSQPLTFRLWPETGPYSQIELLSDADCIIDPETYRRNMTVTVTGIVGSTDIPSDLAWAATVLTANVLTSGKAELDAESESIEGYNVKYGKADKSGNETMAWSVVDSYRPVLI